MTPDPMHLDYSPREELANGLTHAVAALLSITGLVVMLVFSARYGNVWHVVSASIYGATMVLLYTSSTLYHLVPSPPLKTFFRKLDHAMIFILIAGTYTPYTLVNLRGPWGWSLFGIVWGIAIVGIIMEGYLSRRIRWLSLSLYLGLGWIMVIALKPLFSVLAPGGIALLLAGGLLYSLGVLFYVWKSLAYQHAIWHLFVMGGSLCHFFSIFFYVIPYR